MNFPAICCIPCVSKFCCRCSEQSCSGCVWWEGAGKERGCCCQNAFLLKVLYIFQEIYQQLYHGLQRSECWKKPPKVAYKRVEPFKSQWIANPFKIFFLSLLYHFSQSQRCRCLRGMLYLMSRVLACICTFRCLSALISCTSGTFLKPPLSLIALTVDGWRWFLC